MCALCARRVLCLAAIIAAEAAEAAREMLEWDLPPLGEKPHVSDPVPALQASSPVYPSLITFSRKLPDCLFVWVGSVIYCLPPNNRRQWRLLSLRVQRVQTGANLQATNGSDTEDETEPSASVPVSSGGQVGGGYLGC